MTGKRKQHQAPDRPPTSTTALTVQNLAAWDVIMSPKTLSTRPVQGYVPAMPSITSNVSTRSRLTEKLEVHRFFLDRNHSKPEALGRLINDITTERFGDASPKSKEIARLACFTTNMKEAAATSELENLLGYKHEISEGGEPGIWRGRDEVWRQASIPVPNVTENKVLEAALDAVGVVPQPRPDIVYGYSATTFTAEEKDVIKMLPAEAFLTDHEPPYFPYWIMEWKAHKSGGWIWHAERQAIRDGAAAVNAARYIYEPSERDSGEEKSAVFSACISSTEVVLRVHWRRSSPTEGVSWEADEIAGGRLKNERDMFKVRSVILNILDWARNARLKTIKTALAARANTISEKTQHQPEGLSLNHSIAAEDDAAIVSPPVTSIAEFNEPSNKKRRLPDGSV